MAAIDYNSTAGMTDQEKQYEYGRRWKSKNRERYLENHRVRGRARNAKHADRLNREAVEYRKRNKSKIQAWRDQNRIMLRAKSRAYYQKNRIREIARNKKYKEENPGRVAASRAIYYVKNKQKVDAHTSEWRKKNPGKYLYHMSKRRALERAATINLKGIKEWMHSVRSKPSAKCYYCDLRIDSSDVHFDHIVALSKGGSHSVENLCVSCPKCNLSKNNKPVRIWIRTGQQLLEL